MEVSSINRFLPWWSKIAGKMILNRLPVSYSVWQRLGLFRHGAMDQAAYALGVFDLHMARTGLQDALAGKTILELGPGDSVACAIIASAHGARATLVDVCHFAAKAPSTYLPLISLLKAKGLNAPDISHCETMDDVLAVCGAEYLTHGLNSLATIKSESIDLIYSQAVLEHVRCHEFLAIQRECARVLTLEGVCSHQVDLRDHLGGGLNNLRFSRRLWESKFFVQSGFYTNRIHFQDMASLFNQAGFAVDVIEMRSWNVLPIRGRQLAPEFRDKSEKVLNVSGFHVLLKRR